MKRTVKRKSHTRNTKKGRTSVKAHKVRVKRMKPRRFDSALMINPSLKWVIDPNDEMTGDPNENNVKNHTVRVKKKRTPTTGRFTGDDVRLDDLFLRRAPKVRIKRSRDPFALRRMANNQIPRTRPTLGERRFSEVESHQATVDALKNERSLSPPEQENLIRSEQFLDRWEKQFKNQPGSLDARDREIDRRFRG